MVSEKSEFRCSGKICSRIYNYTDLAVFFFFISLGFILKSVYQEYHNNFSVILFCLVSDLILFCSPHFQRKSKGHSSIRISLVPSLLDIIYFVCVATSTFF